MANLRTILAAAADLVYPKDCPACQRLLTPGETEWCTACPAELLAATATPRCPRCAAPAEPYLVDSTGCRACRGRANPIDGIVCAGPYASLLGQLIRTYKYHRRQRLDRPLGTMLADAISAAPWRAQIDAFVPVPASLRERLHYRFWPVRLLAETVSRHLAMPSLPILTVSGKKRRQIELATTERGANVRGRFHLRRGAHVDGARLCIIDDVMTSGATLRETARTLKKAGAARVYAAVLTRAISGPA